MAKLSDDLERHVDDSMPFLFEKLGDLTALNNYWCLTVAQCALLMPAILSSKKSGDMSETASTYIQLAFLDIARGELSPKHPETLLPYSQYLRMMESGMFGIEGENMPVVNAGWLVPLEEAERWIKNKDISINFEGVKAELAKLATADDVPTAKVEAVRNPVATQQNDAIINWLKVNQHDPLKLPVPPSGKAGVKKLCRDALCKNSKPLFSSPSVFDTAWERLRANKKIVDTSTPFDPPIKSGKVGGETVGLVTEK